MNVINFAAGPAVMPREVLEQARAELLDWHGSGMSVLEMPFTGPHFQEILADAGASLRELLGAPDDYHLLFLQGGAYAHFALVAMNLFGRRRAADYVETGHWARRAATEAARHGTVSVAASAASGGFVAVPAPAQWDLDPTAAYCHITTNETADGVQFHEVPDTGAVPLVADMTSDFLSRPVDVTRYGLFYASAQKNVGPAGLTVVAVRDDLLGRALPQTPAVFNYTEQARSRSKVSTPPTFAVYLAGLVFRWVLGQGGLAEMGRRVRARSDRLYALVDAGGFYRCPVEPAHRSQVNPCFRLPDEQLEQRFLDQAAHSGLLHLQGHPARGGIRASFYNAMPEHGVDALLAFMEEFAHRHG